MRSFLKIASVCTAGALVLASASMTASSRAGGDATKAADLPVNAVTCSDLQPSNSPLGVPVHLRAGVYGASKFPIPIQLSVPDAGWSGGQWKTGSTGCYSLQHGGLGQAPYYGWVSLGHGAVAGHQRGSIVIMTSYGHTASVAAVVGLLKSQPGATVEQPVPTTVAGLAARQLDGKVDAAHHQLFAFTKPGSAAGAHVDGIDLGRGALFRVLALATHGRTVVVYIVSGSLAASQFPSFLNEANRLLHSLRFPKGA